MIISISGIRRSGNHAIAMWLIEHSDSCEFYNNFRITPRINKPPNREIYFKLDHLLLELKATRQYGTEHNDNDTLHMEDTYYGLENHEIEEIHTVSNNLYTDHKVLILRDPINNLASILRNRSTLVPLHKFRSLWKSYATDESLVKVIYDKWFINSEYRRDIEKILGIPENDNGMERIHHMGGGSSFDGQSLQRNAQEMKVLKRWWDYRLDDKFLDIINDKELLEIRQEIFGKLPANLRHRLRTRKRLTDEELITKHNLK